MEDSIKKPHHKSLKKTLRIDEVANWLDCSNDTVYRLISSGDLPAYKIGARSLRVRVKDLEAFIERRIQEYHEKIWE